MQLQFGFILQQLLPLITFNKNEKLQLELETSKKVDSSNREIDILLRVRLNNQIFNSA